MRTGRSLLTLNSRELFSVAFHLFYEDARRTQEEADAQEKRMSVLRDIEYEHETGMPAITQWLPSADQMVRSKPVGEGVKK